MKELILKTIGVLVLLAMVVSCGQDDETDAISPRGNSKSAKLEAYDLGVTVEELALMPQNVKEKRAASIKLSHYIVISDSSYALEISKDDAEKIGVSKGLYDEILSDINITNEAIRNARENGAKIELPDIKTEAEAFDRGKRILQAETRSGNNGKNQYGTITTGDTSEGMDSFYPTIDKSSVLFTCRTAAAPLPVYTCKTYVFGQWNSSVKAGTLFTNTDVSVPLAASGSGLCANVFFTTTDSNGGSCTWQAK